MEIRYTTPVLKKGKPIDETLKGTAKLAEQAKQAKQEWYVEYYFDGVRKKVTGGINRIKDYKEKQDEADSLLLSIINKLNSGFNPNNPTQYLEEIQKQNIPFADCIKIFLDYHKKHQSRTSTIASYKSKLNHFKEKYPDIQLADITTKHLEEFVIEKVTGGQYSQKSVKLAKGIFSAFFTIMIELGYVTENPVATFNKKIKSFKQVEESHLPYSEDQLKNVMQWLDDNDAYGALFVRFIYYTCVRPSELKQLKVGDIDVARRSLVIRAAYKKVTSGEIKDDIINIPLSFIPELKKLNLDTHDKKHFLLGSTETIISETPVSKNTPYRRLVKCLEALGLNGQGYDLYSIKHTSNINRWRSGWLIDQIMVANRHTNINQTLTYLRDIKKETDIKDLDVPAI
jgi:integrase